MYGKLLLDQNAKASIEIELEQKDILIGKDKDITFLKEMSPDKLLEICRQRYNFPVSYILIKYVELRHHFISLNVSGIDMDSWTSYTTGNNALHWCAWNTIFTGQTTY